jgi:HEXXH motif-containing protein
VHIYPDSLAAVQDQAAVRRIVRMVVERHHLCDIDVDRRIQKVMLSHLSHPAVVAAAHALQRATRSGRPSSQNHVTLADRLRHAAACAVSSAQRASSNAGLWVSVDLAEPDSHLRESLARALAVIPPPRRSRGGDDQGLAGSEVTCWRETDRAVFRETVDLLHAAWPQMLAELQEIIYQVALVHGKAIDGFTDFMVHGAVMINQARLVTGDTALPGAVRLAEALVHEGAHTRCNAAAVRRPFLRPANGDGELVQTPLRADPRPLAGLFQQLVVLVRSALLYRRLPGASNPAHRARQHKLIDQAQQGAQTLARHADALTDHGQEVLAEATALLDRELAGAC